MGQNYFDQFDTIPTEPFAGEGETPCLPAYGTAEPWTLLDWEKSAQQELRPPGVTKVAPTGGLPALSAQSAGNYFDQFDGDAGLAPPGEGNFFDQFDTLPAMRLMPPPGVTEVSPLSGLTKGIADRMPTPLAPPEPLPLPDWMTNPAPASWGDAMQVIGIGMPQDNSAQAPPQSMLANRSPAPLQAPASPSWDVPVVAGAAASPLRESGYFDSIDAAPPYSASGQTPSPYNPLFLADAVAPMPISAAGSSDTFGGMDMSGRLSNLANGRVTGALARGGRSPSLGDERPGYGESPGIDIWNPPPGGYSLYTLRPNQPPSYGIVRGKVVGTTFSGPHDIDPDTGKPNTSAYTNKTVDPNALGISLPYGFPSSLGKLPGILFRITSLSTGKSVVAPIIDKGPHDTKSPFWRESPPPNGVYVSQTPNHSRLDMTPATARAMGLRVSESLSEGPMLNTPNKDEVFYIEQVYPLFNDPYATRIDSPAVHAVQSRPRRRH